MSGPVQKLLDYFRPPERAGRLLSFCVLTYQFQSDFFETELLPGLFNLGVWQTRGWSSRVALERYLADSYVGVVMDGSVYQDRPSLRVDLVPFVRPGGTTRQHAKVYLLHFEECVRLIVTSANLTEPGFRRNRETAVAFDCTPKRVESSPLIRQALEGWKQAIGPALPDGMQSALGRTMATLDTWEGTRSPRRPSSAFVWGGLGSSLPAELARRWPEGEVVSEITVVSPFWSQNDAGPMQALVDALRQKGTLDPAATIRLFCETVPQSKDPLPSIPPSFAKWARGSKPLTVVAYPVDPTIPSEEGEDLRGLDLKLVRRSLHAKLVHLSGPKTSALYLGSANCTHRGWAIASAAQANLEAGVCFISREPGALNSMLPRVRGSGLDLAQAKPSDVQYLIDAASANPWPAFLRSAILRPLPKSEDLVLVLEWAEVGRERCEIRIRGDEGPAIWQGTPQAGSTEIALSPQALERIVTDREVTVRWGSPARHADFPVLVSEDAKDNLPIAPGVRQPGEDDLLRYYQGRVRWEDLFPDPSGECSPGAQVQALESAVDTSKIPSYQMREFVEALPGMIASIKGTPPEQRALRRSLFGPVSPVVLAKHVCEASRNARRTSTAAAFQILEISVAVARARAALGHVGDKVVDGEFGRCQAKLDEILRDVRKASGSASPGLRQFEREARSEIERLMGAQAR